MLLNRGLTRTVCTFLILFLYSKAENEIVLYKLALRRRILKQFYYGGLSHAPILAAATCPGLPTCRLSPTHACFYSAPSLLEEIDHSSITRTNSNKHQTSLTGEKIQRYVWGLHSDLYVDLVPIYGDARMIFGGALSPKTVSGCFHQKFVYWQRTDITSASSPVRCNGKLFV